MPELPEVETIRRRLATKLVGRTIVKAVVGRSDIVGYPAASQLVHDVAGRKVVGLNRHGKYLILELDKQKDLIFHLRLSGHLELLDGAEEAKWPSGPTIEGPSARRRSSTANPDPRTPSPDSARPKAHRFERARLLFSGGTVLSFIEPRVLGKVYLVDRDGYPRCLNGMKKMGPEPIERGFTPEYLAGRLAGRRTTVKNLLLDQTVCCGVGNIYSDEALHRAGIRPSRVAADLSKVEVARLSRALRHVIRSGIRWCGTTLDDDAYLLPDGGRGGFQKRLMVVGREGQPCRRSGCGGIVTTCRFGARNSRYCPDCQH